MADGKPLVRQGGRTQQGNISIESVTGLSSELGAKVSDSDPRLSDSREWTAATVPQAEAEAGTATTRRAWTAQRVRQAIVAWFDGVSGALGRTILTRTTAAQVRSDIGLGTAATRNVGTAAGNVMEVGTGTRRIATTSGVVAIHYARIGRVTNDTSIAFLLSGGGDFGSAQRQNIIITAGSRQGTISATHTELTGTNHNSKVMVYYVSLGDDVFDIWISKALYQKTISLHVLDSFGEIVDTPVWETDLPEGAVLVTPNTYLHTGNLLQTTGQSTEYPMTQKAVTDALGAKSGLGVGQTWRNVSRKVGTTYTNSTGKPIQVGVQLYYEHGPAKFYVDGLELMSSGLQVWAVIPPGSKYKVTGGFSRWVELR